MYVDVIEILRYSFIYYKQVFLLLKRAFSLSHMHDGDKLASDLNRLHGPVGDTL